MWCNSAYLQTLSSLLRNDFNEWPFTVHIPIHVNIWDPILCAHLGACYVLKLAWWWLHEQPKHVATRDLTLYLLTIEIVVSGRKYTYVLLFFLPDTSKQVTAAIIFPSDAETRLILWKFVFLKNMRKSIEVQKATDGNNIPSTKHCRLGMPKEVWEYVPET